MQKSQELKKAKHKRQKAKKKGKWYTPKMNTNLYISGLPATITPEILKEFFSRAGVIRIDKFTGLPKIKLYYQDNKLKGDALVSYAKPESLTIAVTMLDKQEIVTGYPVHLEPVISNS
jgi:HIV Tat-specific factor 1